MQRTSAWILVAATVLLTALGQVLIKWQAGKMGPGTAGAGLSSLMRGLQLLLNPWVLAGLLSAFLASACWMVAMTRLELSEAYPFTALNFVLILLAGHYLFSEPVTWGKAIGTLLIVAGVVVTAYTAVDGA
jgi:multidrug transporter EmrE-like cation transporter